ncbi:hypothetical protein EUX98_g2642 [Antrodiella citrinella]|uniref:Glycoside hydrolase family 88 protein n=1 Tax=Antrodiella citrinella TaxID=2447956 RepID=A0A4S4N0P2_9APHY|nr:hypothetical protein EUX98_g2642 [Antrodiella citrinella]
MTVSHAVLATVLCAVTLVSSAPNAHPLSPVTLPVEAFSPLIAQKVLATANTLLSPAQYPQYTDRIEGTWQWFSPDTWTTGFFPSTLYALNARSTLCSKDSGNLKETDWLELGRTWSAAEVPLETHTGVGHDVGFLSYPFMDELVVNTHNATAVTAVNNFAKELAARFSPIVGCTRSWDSADPTDFQVIIDNMMNLQVLFASADLNGNDTLRQIAISHARKTAINHIRPDGGSFHVVDYNSTTGKVIDRRTSQGYANNSTWSRGQAWGIYGFANSSSFSCQVFTIIHMPRYCAVYKQTNLSEFLQVSRHMAAYFLDHLPKDGIVPWDFNAPLSPPRPADTSAATIASMAFLLLAQQELAQQPTNTTGANLYVDAAVRLLQTTTALAWKPSWRSLLSNGTVNNPAQNNLTGIVYGTSVFF